MAGIPLNAAEELRGQDIEIRVVANGFLVMPVRSGDYGLSREFRCFHVFPTVAALADWIEGNYDPALRSGEVMRDVENTTR